MKIAVWHNLPSGGGKRTLYDHVRGLKARGHDIEAWCPPTADRSYLPLSGLVPEHVVDLDWPPRRRWRDWALGNRSLPSLRAMEAHCRACAGQIAAGGFDLLFANSCQFLGAAPIGRFVGLPSALYLQEPFRRLYEAMPRLLWLAPRPPVRGWYSPDRWAAWLKDHRRIANARIQAREEWASAAAFDRILVNSLFSRESVLRAYGLDAQPCYLGIDLDRFVDRGVERDHMVVGLGSFTPAKNIALAIEAVALLPRPRPQLVWIGNLSQASYRDEMIALAAARDVDFQPHLRVSDEELVAFLNRAKAMVYTPRLEPFGLAPIEAGACGVPVVAIAEGGVRETVTDGVTGLLTANRTDAVAAALSRLLGDAELARSLGANARAAALSRWSHQAATDRIEKALVQVIAGPRKRRE
jgi:glycosyltransferase involved in cell wall biosynthesis